jgi:hypothetical protein
MGNRFASGKNAISQCDRCDFRFPLKELRSLVIKTKNINMLVCRSCWDPDQPQLQLGMYPVDDPQALRNPRPDRSYTASGNASLTGLPSEGSRIIQWGWAPVGGTRSIEDGLTPNNLLSRGVVADVTIATT